MRVISSLPDATSELDSFANTAHHSGGEILYDGRKLLKIKPASQE